VTRLPPGATVRRDAGLYGYERALRRVGMELIAGVDEAGRGACAGPLVARERVYAQVVRKALAWSVVVIESDECDRLGMHVANVEALRRAVALLELPPEYVLTDGFPVDGLGVPGLAMWKGDRVAACISAASVLAKVTRDRIMVELDGVHPAYDFKTHKGYITDVHSAALVEHGPCSQHRMRFVNVRRAAGIESDPSDPTIEEGSSVVDGSSVEPVETTTPSVARLVESTRVEATSPLGRRGESA
jgi:ribonuclease HII